MSRKAGPGSTVIPLLVLFAVILPLVIVTAAWPQRQGANIQHGQEEFSEYCAHCHDHDAEGDGPEHTEFIPHPANLTLMRDTPAMAASIVKNGVPGTPMPPFPNVDQPTILDIYAFIESQPPETHLQWDYPWSLPEEQINAATAPSVYVTACMDCHGPNGMGDGHWAMNDPHVWPKPANFHARNSEMGRLYHIISEGRPGTFMTPQKFSFPEEARWALAQYAYSMYDPNSNSTIPTGRMEKYTNPYTPDNTQIVEQGLRNYDLYCAPCHGVQAKGTFLAPAHIDRKWRYGGGSDNALFTVITKGVPGKLMPSFTQLTEQERWAVITYFRHRGGLPYPLPLEHEEEGEHGHQGEGH